MEDIYTLAALVLTLLVLIMYVITSQLVIAKQHRTIDRLTDKLMARDYGEYKRLEASQRTVQEAKERKPMSYYDDPSINVEDDK